jgi:hypothetical protein
MSKFKNKTLFIINGFPLAGKDYFIIEACNHFLGWNWGSTWTYRRRELKIHSTVDTVKSIAETMGWDGTKTPENRKMLSELKDFYTTYFDGPYKEIIELMEEANDFKVVFSCVREPKEIDKLIQWRNLEANYKKYNIFTILVTGKNQEMNQLSHSDLNVLNYPYNYQIHNDMTDNFAKIIPGFINDLYNENLEVK